MFHRRTPKVQAPHRPVAETVAATKALLAKIAPLFAQIKDPTQQVLFVSGMIPPRGPHPFSDSDQGSLQLQDFPSVTLGRWQAIEMGIFNPADGTVVDAGGNLLPVPGPNVLPYGELLKLVAQAQALHGV